MTKEGACMVSEKEQIDFFNTILVIMELVTTTYIWITKNNINSIIRSLVVLDVD